MATVHEILTITGASDDLIEIDGVIREELNVVAWGDDSDDNGDEHLIAVSNGALLRVRYDEDGLWRFTILAEGDGTIAKVEGSVEDDRNDVVNITSPNGFKWVVASDQAATRLKGE